MRHSQIAYQNEQLLLKKFFDLMISLESDEITALWPNDFLTLTFYEAFSNYIYLKMNNFCKRSFLIRWLV